MNELKNIAKKLKLNLSYLNNNNKRKIYKKDELYKNIKTYFKKKKTK